MYSAKMPFSSYGFFFAHFGLIFLSSEESPFPSFGLLACAESRHHVKKYFFFYLHLFLEKKIRSSPIFRYKKKKKRKECTYFSLGKTEYAHAYR